MNKSDVQDRIVAGVMTGTSMDGIDVVLTRLSGRGLAMRAQLLRHHSQPLGVLASCLRRVAEQGPHSARDLARLAWAFGELHAEAIEKARGAERLDLVAVHGQTVVHEPPVSWQLINPAPLAARLRCPVVFDLRQADLAAGGQGAPITPIADWMLFRDPERRQAIVNLGGFANATILPAGRERSSVADIRGFDVCVCNQLLDGIARQKLGRDFDEDGAAARRGAVAKEERDALRRTLRRKSSAGRSLGTGDELDEWVLAQCRDLSGEDAAATAVDAIASCILDHLVPEKPELLLAAGGGAKNRTLIDRLRARAGMPVMTTADRGIPVEAREALAITVLGALCADGVAITLPQVTGCDAPAPVAGSWVMG